MIAASYHRTEFIKWLIEYGKADVNYRDTYGRTPLLIATQEASHYRNDPDCIQVLLGYHADTNLCDQHDRSPLLATNHLELVNLLLNHKANPAHRNDEGTTCLMKNVDKPAIVNCLLQHGAKTDINIGIDIQNKKGQTALMLAIKDKQPDTVALLLACNCSLEPVDEDNQSAAHYAIQTGQKDIFAMLCKHCPGMEAHYAVETATWLYFERFGKPLPTNINEMKGNKSPLIEAVAANDCELAEQLLHARADVNAMGVCPEFCVTSHPVTR